MRHKIRVVHRSEALPTHITWDRVARCVLPPMGVGFVLIVWQPLTLVPPAKSFSGLIYVLCAVAWIPLLLLFAWRHPAGAQWKLYALVAAGVIPVLMALSLLLSTLTSFAFEPKCESISSPNWLTRYECRTLFALSDSYLKETFESVPFTPVMWRIDKKNCSLNGCY